MKINQKVIAQLQTLNGMLDSINNKLYNCIDTNNVVEFKVEYNNYLAIKKLYESIAKCGYKNLEIEKFATNNI